MEPPPEGTAALSSPSSPLTSIMGAKKFTWKTLPAPSNTQITSKSCSEFRHKIRVLCECQSFRGAVQKHTILTILCIVW